MRTNRPVHSSCPLTIQYVAHAGRSALPAGKRCTMAGGRDVSRKVAGIGTMSGMVLRRSVLMVPVTLWTLVAEARCLHLLAAVCDWIRCAERLVVSRDRYAGTVTVALRASSHMYRYNVPKSSKRLLASYSTEAYGATSAHGASPRCRLPLRSDR